MKDLETRADLEKLLTEFYSVVTNDAQIGHHFAELDLPAHLPGIVDFWEKILFGKQVYFGNPLAVHQKLHEKSSLNPQHFRRWVGIFSEIVDKFFKGEKAESAKLRAKMIAHSLNQNLNRAMIQDAR